MPRKKGCGLNIAHFAHARPERRTKPKVLTPKQWMDRHRVSIGDMITVTNVAGKSYTGILRQVKSMLGFIELENDPRFAFSLYDAKVRPASKNARPSRFESRIDDFQSSSFIYPSDSPTVDTFKPDLPPAKLEIGRPKGGYIDEMLKAHKPKSMIIRRMGCSEVYVRKRAKMLRDAGLIPEDWYKCDDLKVLEGKGKEKKDGDN